MIKKLITTLVQHNVDIFVKFLQAFCNVTRCLPPSAKQRQTRGAAPRLFAARLGSSEPTCSRRLSYGLLLIGLTTSVASGQVKIDNIELTKNEAKNYFLDCQMFPDTIWFYSNGMGIYMTDEYKEAARNSMGEIFVWREKTKEEKRLSNDSVSVSFGDDCIKMAFIVPRKPSAKDYAKYVRRKATQGNDN